MQQRSDPTNWLYVSNCYITVDSFPDGSFRFSLDGLNNVKYSSTVPPHFDIVLKTTLPEAIMALYQVISAIDQYYGEDIEANITLYIQTIPDQRADRVERPGMSVPVQATAAMIAAAGFNKIVVYDPHSPVFVEALEAYSDDIEIVTFSSDLCFGLTVPAVRIDHVVAVDKGAIERAVAVANFYNAGIIFADKNRVDGKVIGHTILTSSRKVEADDTIWVVDDLCDGGATFISIAKLLRETFNFRELNLYVTHGLFSRGKEELFKHFTEIHSLFDRSEQNG